jgi:hypothetical protein
LEESFLIQKKKSFPITYREGMSRRRYLSIQPWPPAHVVLAAVRDMG